MLKGPQKDDAKIIDELKTWLNPKSTNKEKIDAAGNLVTRYLENAGTDITNHIQILGISNLTTDNLKK